MTFTIVLSYSFEIFDGQAIVIHPFILNRDMALTLAWHMHLNCEIIRSIFFLFVICDLTKEKPFFNSTASALLLINIVDFFTYNLMYSQYNKYYDLGIVFICFLAIFIRDLTKTHG